MNELKSFNSERIYWAVEQVEKEAGDIAELNLDDNLFYLKAEVDKVIADLEEKIAMLENLAKASNHDFASEYNELKIEIFKLQGRVKEIRHHKYKRCLDNAYWCKREEQRLEAISPIFDTDKEYWEYGSDYWLKWQELWLKIAEKFKKEI